MASSRLVLRGNLEPGTITFLPRCSAEIAEFSVTGAYDVITTYSQLDHVATRMASLPAFLLVHLGCHIVELVGVRTLCPCVRYCFTEATRQGRALYALHSVRFISSCTDKC